MDTTRYGLINAHMIGTEAAPGEYVDWSTPDIMTRQEWRELLGDEVEVYAERSTHMIVFVVEEAGR